MRQVVWWQVAILMFVGGAGVDAQTPAAVPPKGTNVVIGRVLEMGTEDPVGGALVTLTAHFDATGKPLGLNAQERPTGVPAPWHVFTTGSGYFVFRDLPSGRYSLATRSFSYLNSDVPPVIVEIAEGDRPTTVAVHLWKYAAISGRVLDERGEPVVDMPVVAMRRAVVAGRFVLEPEGAAVQTDDRGAYRLARLPPGSYVVGVRSTTFSVPAALSAEIDAVASDRAAASQLSSTMANGGSIIRSGEGQRIGDMVLQRAGPQLPLSADGLPLGFATTLYPGTTDPTQATLITLASGEGRRDVDFPVTFSRTVAVSGVVTGPKGPEATLTVRLVPPGADTSDFDGAGVANAVTDGTGAFTFVGVIPGDYTLKAATVSGRFETGDGMSLWAAQQVTVGDRPVIGLEVMLRPGTRISGEVRYAGAPTPGVSDSPRHFISLQPAGSGIWRTLPAVVNSDLTLRTTGDPPGRYILQVHSVTGWEFQSAMLAGKPLVDDLVDLGDADLTDLVITVGPTPAGVSGLITGGTPEVGTDVIVFSADSTAWREGIFNRRRVDRVRASSVNSYEVSGLSPGDYYIAAVSSKWTRQWQDPAFLERIIPGATRFTLAASEKKTVGLTAIVPRDR